jgi:3'-phosphoadenosine 5'-phosphosulfate sulfotransferase (PAPS reductase)/FAD synthetase
MNHIVALSGGKDSTAMALWLAENEPQDYQYVITPTGDELPEMYEHWQRLEELLGAKLTVVSSGKSLQGLIRDQNALPNWRMRWCTRMLKIEPYKAYLMEHTPAVSYVGLRADEPDTVRRGMRLDTPLDITQRYPLRELGWTISDVWEYLDNKGISIPTRTDCARCFFQTLPEWWNLWRYHPADYESAMDDEERTGHTFRSAQRDSQPAALRELAAKFERGYVPKGAAQLTLMESRPMMCRTCSL